MYAQGRGVEKDSLLAVNLYIRSAKNGYSESLDNLSLIVDLEINTAKREREAAEERAARPHGRLFTLHRGLPAAASRRICC